MTVSVPNVVGLARNAAEAQLTAARLRYIAQFPFSGTGDGHAASQSPAAGTEVPALTVVKVAYPTTMGPLDDAPVSGPTLPLGTYEARINGVRVGNPYGTGQGAWIDFAAVLEDGEVVFNGVLYFDHAVNPGPLPDRTEWMRRGAMLGLAQRAFTTNDRVRVITAADEQIVSIEVFKS